MRPDPAERIPEVVAAALELRGIERTAFLDEACAGDSELRAEVESLLEHETLVGDFIEAPPSAVAAQALEAAEAEEFVRRKFGAYETIRELGRGGLGTVYLAARADDVYQKEVALKLLRRGLDTDDILRRFRNERQILARLEHPHIARLIDGGTSHDGLPYFVMEYVAGEPVTTYCERRSLTTRERLELFRVVCAAVAYAHQHLVIHRDLKPSNILVTAEGEVKLLDFGIAKLLDTEEEGADLTLPQERVLTPNYASPEQIRAEQITTASDVYSLGVILCELLTGARTSSLTSKGIHGDLANIIDLARRPEPERRYRSVEQFSEDIRRHLTDLPVHARRSTRRYRAGKFIQRHKPGVAAAVLVALSLIAGFIATIWQAQRATRERDRAERRFTDVRHLSDALLFEIAPKIERLEGATEAREAVLSQSLRYLDSLAGEARDDRALQSELAAAYEKIGELQGNPTNPNLVALSDALSSYGKANAIRRALLVHAPEDREQRRQLADNYRALGDIHYQTNEPTASQRDSEAALAIYTELLRTESDSQPLRRAQARTIHDLGLCLSTNGKKAESMAYFRRTLALGATLQKAAPNDVEVSALLADGHRQLGNALSWELKQRPAEAEMAEAVRIYEQLMAGHPEDLKLRTGLYQTYMMTSNVFEEVDNARAHDFALKALDLIERMAAKDPANLRAAQQLAKTYSRLGVTLANIGQHAESVVYLEKAVTGLRSIIQNETKNRRFTQDLALALMRLGDARRQEKQLPEAQAALEKSIALLTDLAAGDSADNTALRNFANASAALAQTHRDRAAQASGEVAAAQQTRAQHHQEQAIAALRQLEARGALSKFDRKSLAEMQAVAGPK